MAVLGTAAGTRYADRRGTIRLARTGDLGRRADDTRHLPDLRALSVHGTVAMDRAASPAAVLQFVPRFVQDLERSDSRGQSLHVPAGGADDFADLRVGGYLHPLAAHR